MNDIVDVKFGQPLDKEVWLELAERMEVVFQRVETSLFNLNGDGMGKEAADTFRTDANLTLTAIRRAAENDWYGKDMILTDEQAKELYKYAKTNCAYNSDTVANLVFYAICNGEKVVVNADW